MTEDEAKTKWCPMNRFSYSNCVGSKCAMWRWDREPEHKLSMTPVEGWLHLPANPVWPERWVEPHSEAKQRRPGFCGLAGAPL